MDSSELMDLIYEVEGFTVYIDAPQNGLINYFVRKFNGENNVTAWKRRFLIRYPGTYVEVYEGNGKIAHGNMRLKNVRDSHCLDCLRKEIRSLEVSWDYERNRNYVLQHGKDDVKDSYQVLGLKSGCSSADVKEAYWRLSKLFHPNVYDYLNLPDEIKAFTSGKFMEIKDAYDKLAGSLP